MPADLGNWAPWTPQQVFDRFSATAGVGRPRRWWLCGGEALDLFVGRPTRVHDDIDVSILRDEATRLAPILPGWGIFLAHHGTLTEWDRLPIGPPVNSLWCRERAEGPWRMQVMLEEGTPEHWACRRFPELKVPMSQAVRHTAGGLPYMAPELQLFMKAKDARPKDDADFAVVAPLLSATQSAWLADALGRYYPEHPWCTALANGGDVVA